MYEIDENEGIDIDNYSDWILAEEIAKELDMTINDVKESMKNSGRHVSMDAPLVEGEDSNLYDVLNSGESPNPDRSLLHESLRTEIERALEIAHENPVELQKNSALTNSAQGCILQ